MARIPRQAFVDLFGSLRKTVRPLLDLSALDPPALEETAGDKVSLSPALAPLLAARIGALSVRALDPPLPALAALEETAGDKVSLSPALAPLLAARIGALSAGMNGLLRPRAVSRAGASSWFKCRPLFVCAGTTAGLVLYNSSYLDPTYHSIGVFLSLNADVLLAWAAGGLLLSKKPQDDNQPTSEVPTGSQADAGRTGDDAEKKPGEADPGRTGDDAEKKPGEADPGCTGDDAEKKPGEADPGRTGDDVEKKPGEADGGPDEDDPEEKKKKPGEADGGPDEDDPEEKKKKLRLALELLYKQNFVPKLEFAVMGLSYRMYKQRMSQDSRQILQETEASVLADKMAEYSQKLQAMAQERQEVDLKLNALNSEIAAVEKLEADILKDSKLVDAGLKEVSDGNQQVALGQERLAAELKAVETEKYKLFLEKKTLQDLVDASERKQRAVVVRFLKWLQTRPRFMSIVTGTVGIWWAAGGSFVALAGIVMSGAFSGMTALELFDIVGNIIVNEYNDQAASWREKVERADKQRGKKGQEGGSSDSDV